VKTKEALTVSMQGICSF